MEAEPVNSQRGVALISMLLVFALVVTMVGSLISQMWFNIRRTDFHLKDVQAWQYALGGEALARQTLFVDYQSDHEAGGQNAAIDHYNEPWSRIVKPFQADNGEIRLAIIDLQSRFNLNNLVNDKGEINAIQMALFERLLNQLNLDVAIAGKLADWLDTNSSPSAFDSEDMHYLGLEHGYRTANRRIVDVTELLAVDGVTQAMFNRLQPFICALPSATRININTAPAVLISSLVPGLDGDQVIQARDRESFSSLETFLTDVSTAGLVINQDLISVTSQYFQIWVRARFVEQVRYLRSEVFRDAESGTISLLNRNLEPPVAGAQAELFTLSGNME